MAFTILLVDDDPVQGATRQAVLTHAGNKVLVAPDADRAFTLLDDPETANSLNLVITDHLMPGINGPELVARLRRQFPALPILVLSGLPDAEIEYAGMNVVCRMKPIVPEELIRLTRSLCEIKLGRIA